MHLCTLGKYLYMCWYCLCVVDMISEEDYFRKSSEFRKWLTEEVTVYQGGVTPKSTATIHKHGKDQFLKLTADFCQKFVLIIDLILLHFHALFTCVALTTLRKGFLRVQWPLLLQPWLQILGQWHLE